MKVKALGTNAYVEFDGAQVAVERRGPWLKGVPASTTYPIGAILGMNVSPPPHDAGGTLQLVVDPRDASLYAPMTVEYPSFRSKDFARLIEAIEGGLRQLKRPPYLGTVSNPDYPGAYTHIVTPAPIPLPVLPALAATAAPPQWDPATQVERFAALHASGVLTDKEFAAAKTKLIAMMAPAVSADVG